MLFQTPRFNSRHPYQMAHNHLKPNSRDFQLLWPTLAPTYILIIKKKKKTKQDLQVTCMHITIQEVSFLAGFLRVTVAVMKHHNQKRFGEEGVYLVYIPDPQSIQKSQGRNWNWAGTFRQELMWCRDHGTVSLIKKMPYTLTYNPTLWRLFSQLKSPPLGWLYLA